MDVEVMGNLVSPNYKNCTPQIGDIVVVLTNDENEIVRHFAPVGSIWEVTAISDHQNIHNPEQPPHWRVHCIPHPSSPGYHRTTDGEGIIARYDKIGAGLVSHWFDTETLEWAT